MWHVYCLGDLGQWSTSGTSHNRVHTSTAHRHPTRQEGKEREKQGQGNIWVLSFFHSPTHTNTHTHLGFCGFWGCLDSSRCFWTHMRTTSVCMCVCAWVFCLIDSLEPECSLCRVSNSSIMSTGFVFSLTVSFCCLSLPRVFPSVCLCFTVVSQAQMHFSVGSSEGNMAACVWFAAHTPEK